MKFKTQIFTKILDEKGYRQELNIILSILGINKVETVDILFGFAWGNEYRDWTPFKVNITQIHFEIKKAEELNVGRFGHDDFFIAVTDFDLEVLFCHENDVHLLFNNDNPIVSAILNSWKKRNIFLEEKNKS